MGRGARAALVGLAVLVVIAAAGVLVYRGPGPLLGRPDCRAEVGGQVVGISTEQAENAALIAAVALRRGLPARAVSIALATAYQESKILNIDYGDRDSLGLFQQRPSQGWGTRQQILDPLFAIGAFYDALEQVEGYQDMRITEAAQAVQRSGFPEAYEDHAADARILASALTGYSPGAFWCDHGGGAAEEPDRLDEAGLTRRAAAVRRDLATAFGDLALGGFAPGGVRDGHMEGSAHYDGRAVDVFVRPVSPENRRRGWAVASYLVARAELLAIEHVIFDDRVWTAGGGSGWRDYDPPARAGDRAILEHRDHVHADVAD